MKEFTLHKIFNSGDIKIDEMMSITMPSKHQTLIYALIKTPSRPITIISVLITVLNLD